MNHLAYITMNAANALLELAVLFVDGHMQSTSGSNGDEAKAIYLGIGQTLQTKAL